jgi:predicted nuclease of restriction endonuclease-like RecB superfamily
MLTADLVPVRRRGETLQLRKLSAEQRDRLLAAAGAFVAVLDDGGGRRRGEIQKRWDDVEVEPTDFKLLKGLRKLLEDRCTFEPPPGVDPPALRRAVFTAAARQRRELADDETLDADRVLAEAAPELAGRDGPREPWLFADLKEHQILTRFERIDAARLVTSYEWAQRQAVLLRAVSVSVALLAPTPAGARNLFRQMKFRRLLYTLKQREEGGYAIEIDGPFSLFRSVTKYGLNLALMLPALEECGPWTLDARIRWDKTAKLYQFQLEGGQPGAGGEVAHLSDEVEALVARVQKTGRGWTVAPADAILDLPGAGLCVPDLEFRHPDSGEPFYLEVMGFWSRDAVWKRVELVQEGLPYRILFAVSSHLRVSEKVLDGDLPGQLYVYKGSLVASEILERFDAMRGKDATLPGLPVPAVRKRRKRG